MTPAASRVDLRAIANLGGSIVFSTQGRVVEEKLAAEFGIADEDRDFAASHYNSQGHRKWRNYLQFVRDDLVKKGHLSNQRDVWAITAAGYARLS
jgi:Mrr N-terminal domain